MSQLEKVRHELQVAGKKLSSKFSSKMLTVFIDISTFFIQQASQYFVIFYITCLYIVVDLMLLIVQGHLE